MPKNKRKSKRKRPLKPSDIELSWQKDFKKHGLLPSFARTPILLGKKKYREQAKIKQKVQSKKGRMVKVFRIKNGKRVHTGYRYSNP
jgi:hypothetical protein